MFTLSTLSPKGLSCLNYAKTSKSSFSDSSVRFSGGADAFLKKNAEVIQAHRVAEQQEIDNTRAQAEAAMQSQDNALLTKEIFPELTGKDLCEYIRQNPYTDDDDISRAFGPFAPQVLAALQELVSAELLEKGDERDMCDTLQRGVYSTSRYKP